MPTECLLTNRSSNTQQNINSSFLGSGFIGNFKFDSVLIKEQKIFQVFYNEQVHLCNQEKKTITSILRNI